MLGGVAGCRLDAPRVAANEVEDPPPPTLIRRARLQAPPQGGGAAPLWGPDGRRLWLRPGAPARLAAAIKAICSVKR